MEKIEDLKSSLPLTFQKVEIKKYKYTQPVKKIAVHYIDTDGMSPYNFYRPISKTIVV